MARVDCTVDLHTPDSASTNFSRIEPDVETFLRKIKLQALCKRGSVFAGVEMKMRDGSGSGTFDEPL